MQRIGRDAAEDAGVQVAFGALGDDLGVEDAAQAVDDRGDAGRGHAGIGDENGVAGQLLGMLAHVLLDGRAASLFLALEQDFDVDRQRSVGAHERFQRLDEREHLPLVVHRAARIEVAVAHLRLEGWTLPQLDGVHRLHVVVAVEENGRLVFRFEPLAVDERMPVFQWLDEPDLLDADGAELVGDELRGAAHVVVVLVQRADAGDAQQRLEVFEEGVAVGFDVGERFVWRRHGAVGRGGRHGGRCPSVRRWCGVCGESACNETFARYRYLSS